MMSEESVFDWHKTFPFCSIFHCCSVNLVVISSGCGSFFFCFTGFCVPLNECKIVGKNRWKVQNKHISCWCMHFVRLYNSHEMGNIRDRIFRSYHLEHRAHMHKHIMIVSLLLLSASYRKNSDSQQKNKRANDSESEKGGRGAELLVNAEKLLCIYVIMQTCHYYPTDVRYSLLRWLPCHYC